MIARRNVLLGLLAAPALVRRVWADDAPIRLFVGGPAGSSVDQGARSFTPFLERHWPGARVSVVNIPGEVGLAALRALGAAPLDGRALAWVSTPALPARAVDHRGAEHLLDSLALVGAVERELIAIVTQAGSELASARDFIARLNENGASVPIGTPPSGSAPHLAALRLQAMSGTPLNIVAFPSGAAARQAALSGNVAAALLALGDVVEFLRAGKLAGLGIATHRRADAFPDLEPLHDAGLPLSAAIQRGIAVAAGGSPDATMALATSLQAIVADPEFAAQGEQAGFKPAWLPGDAWAAQAMLDRASLARLWASEPWLSIGLG